MLSVYGITLGLQSLLHGRVTKEVLKTLVVPENYWRTLEFRLVYEELQPEQSDRILDVGSPKLLSLFVADKVGAEVYSTDIEDYFVSDYLAFRAIRKIPENLYHPLTADGRCLSFPDGFFSKSFSISVLEHIPGNGDTECIQEIARTLRSGGRMVITIPFAPVSRDEYKDARSFYWSGNSVQEKGQEQVFFQRRYSEKDIFSRLIDPSGMKLKGLSYLGDRLSLPEGKELSGYLHPSLGPLHPLLSRLFHAKPSTSWQLMKKPLGALVVLEKP
jgi:SAM-dependent methyltransferase